MLAGALSCRHLNAHRSDEYIVPEASDGDVADTACPGRILLVEQQVSLPFDQRPKQTNKRLSRRTMPAHRKLTVNSQLPAAMPVPKRQSPAVALAVVGAKDVDLADFFEQALKRPLLIVWVNLRIERVIEQIASAQRFDLDQAVFPCCAIGLIHALRIARKGGLFQEQQQQAGKAGKLFRQWLAGFKYDLVAVNLAAFNGDYEASLSLVTPEISHHFFDFFFFRHMSWAQLAPIQFKH
jgi:hypothetical protein